MARGSVSAGMPKLFRQLICGFGIPSARHVSVVLAPKMTVLSTGRLVIEGGTN